MAPLDLANHLFNFSLPAIIVGLLVALTAPLVMKSGTRRSLWMHAGANVLAGLAALAAGLWYFGNDGKMATYLAMVLLIATTQWLMAERF
jgi:hypothetical protein